MNENSNSLKTENSFWQYYPAFWVFRKTKILVPTKKKKKQKNVSPCRACQGPWRAVSSNQAAKPDTI